MNKAPQYSAEEALKQLANELKAARLEGASVLVAAALVALRDIPGFLQDRRSLDSVKRSLDENAAILRSWSSSDSLK